MESTTSVTILSPTSVTTTSVTTVSTTSVTNIIGEIWGHPVPGGLIGMPPPSANYTILDVLKSKKYSGLPGLYPGPISHQHPQHFKNPETNPISPIIACNLCPLLKFSLENTEIKEHRFRKGK